MCEQDDDDGDDAGEREAQRDRSDDRRVGLHRRELDLALARAVLEHGSSFLVARLGRGACQRRLARPGPGRHAAWRRQPAGRPQDGGLCGQLLVLEPDPADHRRHEDDEAQHGEDIGARGVSGPEGPEGRDVLGPFVERKAVDHRSLLSSPAATPDRWPLTSANASRSTGADSTSSPVGRTMVSGTRSNSGKKSAWNSAMSRPSSSTSGGTRSRFAFLSSQLTMKPGRKASGKKASIPMSWPPKEDSTLFTPVGKPPAKMPTR